MRRSTEWEIISFRDELALEGFWPAAAGPKKRKEKKKLSGPLMFAQVATETECGEEVVDGTLRLSWFH